MSEPRVIDLSDVVTDGWFEDLAADVDEFDDLARVVGERFVGFSFILGIRITSIAYDSTAPDSSQVDFTAMGSDQTQSLALGDFRERLGAALMGRDGEDGELSASAGPLEARDYIGRRRLLLSSLFGVQLLSLEHGGGSPPALSIKLGSVDEQVSLDGLQEILSNAVRAEVARARPNQPFSIDFKRVPRAEAANRDGNYDETIALLGAWPGPLSMFLRTAQGQSLGTPERTKLVRALGALGDAYIEKGQGDWAEDVLRLGIQFGQEMAVAGSLFGLLGKTRARMDRHGEAIGLYRRALSLGADPAAFLPGLAESFTERGRYVAALGCLLEAASSGVSEARLQPLRERVEGALGEPYPRFVAMMAEPGAEDAS